MKITIVGAGNVGTQLAVHCAEKGHTVTLYTSKPDRIAHELKIMDENDRVIHQGSICEATNTPERAFSGAEAIFVTVPAMLMKKIAALIGPYVRPGVKIGSVPGPGGGEYAFRTCMEKGATLFAFQRVPSVARLIEYGRSVRATGYRKEMFVAALPHTETENCRALTEQLLDIKTLSLPNYLTITLTPSNPVLHTVRLYHLFRDYRPGVVYGSVPLFYEDWDLETSETLLQCDDEVQKLCAKFDRFDLSYVRSLRVHYESATADAMTRKISGIPAFKGIKSPTIAVKNGYIPDLDSRYFTADFPFGLSILTQIADLAALDVPCMRKILNWYHRLDIARDEFFFLDHGIDSREKFEMFYYG